MVASSDVLLLQVHLGLLHRVHLFPHKLHLLNLGLDYKHS